MSSSGSGGAKTKRGRKPDGGYDGWEDYMAMKQAKLIEQFHEDKVEKVSDIFTNIKIIVNGLTQPPASELKNLMAAHGGEYHIYQSSNTTHIIASNLPNVKIKNLGSVPIVKPTWITESIVANKLLDYRKYLLYTNQSRTQPALNFSRISIETVTSKTQNRNKNFGEEVNDEVENENLEPQVKDETNKVAVASTSSAGNGKITKTAADPKFLEEFYSNSRLHLIATLGAEFKQLVNQLREKSNGKFPGREKLIALKYKSNRPPNVPTSSIIMHIDMDCFFVSVGLRNHPELVGKPVAITHARSGTIKTNDSKRHASREQEFQLYQERAPEGTTSRVVDLHDRVDSLASLSEVASCSYEARKCGIKNGMFLGQAVKLCPDLKTLPYDFEGYKEVSNTLYNTVASYTLDIEAVSCDEMYVDIKQILIDTNMEVEEWATYIRNEIMESTKCPCSTGFGANKLQARLATRRAKPSNQFYLRPEYVETYMSEIPVADLPGVGYATLNKLQKLEISTCGDLQMASLKTLQSEFGVKLGERIRDQAFGIDNKPLEFCHERKSVSAEINYGIRFKTKSECYNFLESLSYEVFNRLNDLNMKARGLTLKLLVRAEGAPVETAKFLGHGVCDVINKSSTSQMIFNNAQIIFKEVKVIYDKVNVPFEELRGIGIHLNKLEKKAPVNKALENFLKQGAAQPASAVKTVEKPIPKIAVVAKSIQTNNFSKSNQGKPKQTSKTSKSVGKNGKRGRIGKNQKSPPKGVTTLKAFLAKDNSKSLPMNSCTTNFQLLELRSQIDLNTLNELPDNIRLEIMAEYHINSNDIPVGNESSCSTSLTALTESNPTHNKQSPFADFSWKEIKSIIKAWIKQSENEPFSMDVDMLADHLRQMALNRNIDDLKCGFNFMHRLFANLNCSWHQAYFSLVNAVQQGMVMRYGKVLLIKNNFRCCQI